MPINRKGPTRPLPVLADLLQADPTLEQRLKDEGVRRGTPDIFICLPEGRIAWLEMKAKKGVLLPSSPRYVRETRWSLE